MIFDIACNITEKAFVNSISDVILKCKSRKIFPILVGLDVPGSIECINLANEYKLACYAGVHPNSKSEPIGLENLLKNQRVIGLGECGLDFYRDSVEKSSQIRKFKTQLEFNAPAYFFHCRDAHREFMECLSDFNVKGVVHSFTGTIEEANELSKKGFFIGINGCSLRDEEMVREIKGKLMLETDAPYCKIRRSWPVYEKILSKDDEKQLMRRNEPWNVVQVAEAVCALKEVSVDTLIDETNKNVVELFGEKMNFFADEFFKVDE